MRNRCRCVSFRVLMSLPQRAAVCPLLLVLYLAVVAAGCGDQEKVSGQATVKQETEHDPAAAGKRSAEEKLPEMVFRAVPENDPLLGERFRHQAGKFSIRPPASWIKIDIKPSSHQDAAQLLHRVMFRDPQEGDMLDISLIQGGPATLDVANLMSLRKSLADDFKRNQTIKMVGTDLFRYRGFSVIQFMMQQEGRVLLHLMVFKRPGLFLQIVFLIARERYHVSARAVEATIASLSWDPGGEQGPAQAGP